MKLHSYFYFMLLLGMAFGCSQISNGDDITLYEVKIDSIASHYINEGKVKGISIAIVGKKDTLYCKGFGFMDAAQIQPITPQTKFKLASISKLMGAVVVMKLVEENKLRLDQNLSELLPDFPNKEQGEKITLHHLLSHTSGLQDYAAEIDSVFSRTGVEPLISDYLLFFKDRPLLFEPGEEYSYCNSGYMLMALIIENVTGNSLQDVIDRIINEPTGMDMKLIAETVNQSDMSPYYEWDGKNLNPIKHWTWIKGDGGLTSTAIDLARFPFYWTDEKIISKKSYHQMVSSTILNDGAESEFGIGVQTGTFAGLKMIGHTGGNKTLLSKMAYFPEKEISIVVYVNTDNTSSNARKIFGEVALSFFGFDQPDFIGIEEPAEGRHSSSSQKEKLLENPEQYVGTYRSIVYKGIPEIFIKLENSHLYYCESEEYCYRMYSLGAGQFWIREWPLDKILFDIDKNGKIRALKEYYTGDYIQMRRKKN